MNKLIILVFCLCMFVQPVQAQEKPIGWIFIPSLYLYKPLYEIPIVNHEWDTSDLGNRVGWLEQTNKTLDNWGNIGIAGHTPGGLSDLINIKTGSTIILNLDSVTEYYIVVSVNHNQSSLSWTYPTKYEQLTLITCEDNLRLIVVSYRIFTPS